MTTTNLDQISQEITRLMVATEKNEATILPLVRQIWAAFDDAKAKRTTITIEGATNKTAWTKLPGKPKMRYCQYLVRDGNRKRSAPGARDDTPLALLKKLITIISENRNDYPVIKGEAQEICDSLKWYPPAFKQENKEVKYYNRTGEKPGQKKPVKHAKHHHGTTYCGKDAHHANMARSRKHTTCPFCIAGIAANLQINRPEVMVRSLKKDLKETRSLLKHHEEMVATCLPEYRGANYDHSLRAIPECKTEIVELEAKLAIWEAVKTPEQSVEVAKQAVAEHEARRIAYDKQPVHIQSPVLAQDKTEMTLCGEEIKMSFRSFEGTRMAYGAHAVATCEKCIELSKQVGLGVTQPEKSAKSKALTVEVLEAL